MRITPLDIQQKQFSKKYKGFDVDDVNSFLKLIREELEELQRENANLKEEARKIENQLNEYMNVEVSLRDTIIKTQEFVENYKTNAKKNAELIQTKAKSRADELLQEAQQKVVEIHEDITALKGIRKHFKEEMKKLIESCLGRL